MCWAWECSFTMFLSFVLTMAFGTTVRAIMNLADVLAAFLGNLSRAVSQAA